jgi:hypothetical protein
MKIETIEGKTIDTEKLTDENAEIHEALNALYETCKKYNKTFLCRIALAKNKSLGANFTHKGKSEDVGQTVLYLFALIQQYLEESTGGAVSLSYNGE